MSVAWRWFHRLGSPPAFVPLALKLAPWLAGVGGLLAVAGALAGLFVAPPDYQQGDAFRIIYVHVPVAGLSLTVYGAMAAAGIVALVWRMKVAEAAVVAAAPVGAWLTALALVTGMLWGKPMWGTYWDWDARLTSELVLLFFYLGSVALASAVPDRRQGARLCAWLSLAGLVNVVIVKYSVVWWNSLHQGATVLKLGRPSIAGSMLWPLLLTLAGFYLLFGGLWLWRTAAELIRREPRAGWVRRLDGATASVIAAPKAEPRPARPV